MAVGTLRGILSTSARGGAKDRDPKIMLVCSHGSHLTEMLALTDAFKGWRIVWVTHRSAQTEKLPRVRLVPHFGESSGGTALTVLAAFLLGLFTVLKERPAVIVSTGAELAIPLC